ncbi:MAG: rRNA maturation RNase YbeY [Cytophagales bacterium]|nr:rRNA maturation RNase YbeY [Cytophagales bacterium]
MNEVINFFYEEIEAPELDTSLIHDHLVDLSKNHNKTVLEINYIFCSDEYLLQVNIDYLNHDYYTDIITFDNSEEEESIEGDIFISLDRIEDNAKIEQVNFEDEFIRVVSHGLLHLIGFNDKTNEEQEIMTKQENLALKSYKIKKELK